MSLLILLKMAPFRWPTTSNEIMLATEVAARKPKSPADWETILSHAFSSDHKQVDLTGRACRERLECLINKFKEEDKKSLKKWAS